MPLYELGVVLTTTIEEQERETFLGELRQLLAAQGGEIVKEDVWGRRTLAYEIDHQREGYYVFWQYQAPGTAVRPLEYRMRVSDQVLRYIHLNLDREMQRARKMARVRAEQKAAKKASQALAAAAQEA